MYTELPLLDLAENLGILFGVPFIWLFYDRMKSIKNKKCKKKYFLLKKDSLL